MLRPTNFLISLIFLISSISSFAQISSPYQLSKKDIWLTTGSLGAAAISQISLHNSPPLSENNIFNLDPQSIFSPDRFVTRNYNPNMAKASDLMLVSSYGIAGSTLLIPLLKNKNEAWQQAFTLVVLGAQANCITLTGTNIAKRTFLRTRPFVYNPDAPLERKLQADARHSFFSGHTSLTATNCFFAAKVFSDYYPDSKWAPLVWGAAVSIPLVVAVQRVEAGKHFVTDVAVGYVFGALCGYYVPHLHRVGRQSELPSNSSAERQFRLPAGRIMPVWGQGVRGINLTFSF